MVASYGRLVRSIGAASIALLLGNVEAASLPEVTRDFVPAPSAASDTRLVEMDPGLRALFPEVADLETAFGQGNFEQARRSARILLRRIRERFGAGSDQAVTALVNLAAVERRAGGLTEAAAAYERAIRLVEANANARDLRLVRPLQGLGLTLREAGRHDEAVDALWRASFVQRANLGLRSLDQLEVYGPLTESLILLGRYDDAVARQEARLVIVEQATGRGSPELLAVAADAAQWLRKMGRFHEEREVHQRRLALLREQGAEGDPRLAPVYRDIARTYVGALEAELAGVFALERAIDIVKKQPDASPAEHAEILTELGDYYFLFQHQRRGHGYYRRARALLLEAGDVETVARLFDRPAALYVPKPNIGSRAPADLTLVEATLKLAVDTRGRPRALEILRIEPSSEKTRATTLRYMEAARFRPRVTKTGPVYVEKIRFEYRFLHDGGV